jgi:hypothetical protein
MSFRQLEVAVRRLFHCPRFLCRARVRPYPVSEGWPPTQNVTLRKRRMIVAEKEQFKLPGSSLEEVEKILEAHAQRSGPTANEEIARLTGADKTTVSRNNGFLISTGLIQGGNKKESSELGEALGMALHHQQHSEVKRYLQQVVANNTFLSERLTAIRVQRGIKVDDLPARSSTRLGRERTSIPRPGPSHRRPFGEIRPNPGERR